MISYRLHAQLIRFGRLCSPPCLPFRVSRVGRCGLSDILYIKGQIACLFCYLRSLCVLLSLFPCPWQAMFPCVDLLKWLWVFCNSCSSLPEGGARQSATAEGFSFWGNQRWSVEGTLGKNDLLFVGMEPQLMYLKQKPWRALVKKKTDWSTWDNDLVKLRTSVVDWRSESYTDCQWRSQNFVIVHDVFCWKLNLSRREKYLYQCTMSSFYTRMLLRNNYRL